MLEIAKIVKPQGIRGEVKAIPQTNVLAVFVSLKSCTVAGKKMQIERISVRQGFIYIKFKGVDTCNQAEELRNNIISIEKELLSKAMKADDFLIDDLIGMNLYDFEGNFVGQIVDVEEGYGSCDVLILEGGGRRMEAPYVKDVFISQNGTIVVDGEKLKEVLI